jgi:hypothetical protein
MLFRLDILLIIFILKIHMKSLVIILFSSLFCLSSVSAQVSLNFDNEGTSPPSVINFEGLPAAVMNGEYTLDPSTLETLDAGTSWLTLSTRYNGPNPDGYLYITTYPPGLPHPFVGSEVYFHDGLYELIIKLDGTSVQMSGHDANGDWVTYNSDEWAATYDGGGFGPAYVPVSAGVINAAKELNLGLEYQDGKWVPSQQ